MEEGGAGGTLFKDIGSLVEAQEWFRALATYLKKSKGSSAGSADGGTYL